MKQKIHAIATALGFWKLKAKGLKLKAVGHFRQKQLTNRLSLRPSAEPSASLITMMGEGERAMPFNKTHNVNIATKQSQATGSVGLVKRRAGSVACADEGSFYLDFLVPFSSKEKDTSLPPAMRREDFNSKEPNLYKQIITTHFNSPASGGHWAQTFRMEKVNKILKCFIGIRRFSRKLLTNRLPQPAPHKPDASGFARTGEGEAVRINKDNQNDTSAMQSQATGSAGLVKRRAGSWPVRMKDRFTLIYSGCLFFFKGFHAFAPLRFWCLFHLRKHALAFLSAIKKQLIDRKKTLALPPAMRREDSHSSEPIPNKPQITTPFNSPASGVHWAQNDRVRKPNCLKAIGKPSKKQLTNRLLLRYGTQPGASLITMTGRRKAIAVKIRPNLLMLLLIATVVILGKPAKSQTKPLKIGDTIPEAVWNTPMEVLNHPEGKSSIRLSDYKGKLIILDFWATWCVNCVKSFPEEDRLQQEFKNDIVILPVTKQKQSIITAFMQRNNPTKGTHLTVVTDDQILSEIFKHQLMPHVVWIDGAGRVVASTAASYVQAEKIEQVLKGEQLHWTMKRDFMEFDKRHALMGWVDRGGAEPKMIGYSAFTSHLSGVDPVAGLQIKQEEGSQRRYDINMTLGTFSVRAFEGTLPVLSKKQYLYKVKDINNYSCPPSTLYMDWKVQHTFCYEAVMPASFNQSQIKQKMREDLKSYFGLEGKLEYRKVSAWVFRQIATSAKPNRSQDGQTLGNLIWEINERHPELPLAIAERSIEDLIVPKMNGKIDSLPALNKALTAYGITIKAEESEQPFFVLYEQQPNH
jgi:thiol-disulfide isomerase/thioredoxin